MSEAEFRAKVEMLMERALEVATAKAMATTLMSHGKPHEWAEADYQTAVRTLREALEEAVSKREDAQPLECPMCKQLGW